MDTNISTVAQLRKQIEAEYTAAQRGLEGLAQGARHQYITARMENMDRHHRQLAGLVGEERAIQMVAQVFGTPEEDSDGRRQPLVVTTRIDEERKALFTTFLHQHGCVVEDQGEYLRVRFPEGTQREATLSGRDERHSIILPDKTHLIEVYIRHKEYTILNILAGEVGREAL